MRLARASLPGAGLALLLSGCASGTPSPLDPRGPAARDLAALIWTVFALAAIVCVAVLAALVLAVLRRRRTDAEEAVTAGENRAIFLFGIALPAVILLALFGISLALTRSLSAPPAAPALTVEVIARQWWWEVRYPDQGFATANELRIPVGQPVRVTLTSDDVIHSFWVPQLQAKTDMLPGQTTTTWLQASEAGTFRGQCAEYCGAQHAQMGFVVVAEPPEQFDRWLAAQRAPAAQPADQARNIQQGYQVLVGASCSYCHTIRGTSALGAYGPDLTHLASRQTLGAGTLPNTRGNLAAWITNAQGIKPGNRMPSFPLDAQSLQYLLDYLQSLT